MSVGGRNIAGDGGGPITRQWLWWSSASLCAGIALFSFRYLAGMGLVPEVIATNHRLHPWIGIHVGAAATALLIGPLQLLPRLRARRRALHRWFGRIYVVACLIGAIAAFPLALGASTGPITTAGFGTLAILWVVTTVLAWRYARRRQFTEHRMWMIRSFSLTFAAVTLRLYLPLAFALPFAFEASYRAISFLCWVPNILAAELYLRGTGSKPRA